MKDIDYLDSFSKGVYIAFCWLLLIWYIPQTIYNIDRIADSLEAIVELKKADTNININPDLINRIFDRIKE